VNGPSAEVALVTGASSGIGLATALALARRSYTVVATMRDLGRADRLVELAAAAGLAVETDVLDVTAEESVAGCAERLLARHGRIDLVVNNAGMGQIGSLEEVSIADLAEVIDVNCLGVARVTKAFLPTMREARRGHLIAISSIAGVLGQPFNDGYCAAKFALEGLYESLAPVAAEFGVFVSLIEAGMVSTEFYRRSVETGVSDPGPYAQMREGFVRTADGAAATAQSAEDIAELVVSVAADPSPQLRYQSSPDVTQLLGRKLADLDGQRVLRITRRWLS
jgi:NAD(P)-dependent dehydrogenase (short-subunit alcohol dehydrogenase family)